MCVWEPRFSARENLSNNPYASGGSNFDRDPRPWSDARQQTPKIGGGKRDTSRRWRALRPRDVHKDGAAASGHARTGVVVDLNDEVVEMIVPPQPVAFLCQRASERTVVAAIAGALAPGQMRRDAPDRKQGLRARLTIGAPPQAQHAETSARSGAIGLSLVGSHATATEHDHGGERAGEQDAAAAAAGARAHPQEGKAALGLAGPDPFSPRNPLALLLPHDLLRPSQRPGHDKPSQDPDRR